MIGLDFVLGGKKTLKEEILRATNPRSWHSGNKQM